MVAALFVAKNGCYFGLPNVEPWDESRDARLYAGPHPVVAHPPCARWSLLAGLVEARGGKKRGEDDGCFEAALRSVRTYGGVLEHPAQSQAFLAHGLARPAGPGWQACIGGGWTTQVDQGRYGFPAKKPTWLFVSGIDAGDLPRLDWAPGKNELHPDKRARRTGKPLYPLDRMSRRRRAATPLAFREVLLSIARSARPESADGR